MALLLGLPILGLLAVVQSAAISRMTLLYGAADVVLLAVIAWALQPRVTTAWHWAVIGGLLAGLLTALPFGLLLTGYLIATGFAVLLRQRVWHVPVLAMLVATVLGTIVTLGLSWIVLRLNGVALPTWQSLNLVLIPSLLLNLLLSLPVYSFAGDLATWLYPQEIEI
jgi:hypothetical protein